MLNVVEVTDRPPNALECLPTEELKRLRRTLEKLAARFRFDGERVAVPILLTSGITA